MSEKAKSGSLPLSRIIIGLVVLGIVGVAVTFPLWQPYFVDVEVDEAFPTGFDTMPEEQQAVLVTMNEEEPEMAQELAASMMEEDTETNDPMPEMESETEATSSEPISLSTGAFGEYDPVHRGSGSATIFELPDGSRILRFENFEVTNGPDLHVILSANEPSNIRTRPDEGYLDLGELKGNVGNQNYEIPADIDLSNFNYVVIYCEPFHVNFSFAELGDA